MQHTQHFRLTHTTREQRMIYQFRGPDAASQFNYNRMVNSRAMWPLRNQALYMRQDALQPGVHPMNPYVYAGARNRWDRMAGAFPSRISSFGPIMAYPQDPLAMPGPMRRPPFGTRARLAARREMQAQRFAPLTMADFGRGPMVQGAYGAYAPGASPTGMTMADFGRGPARGPRPDTRYTLIHTDPETGMTVSDDYRYDGSRFRQISMTSGNRQRLEGILRTYGRFDQLVAAIRDGGETGTRALDGLSGFFRVGLETMPASSPDRVTLETILPDIYLRGPGNIMYGWNASTRRFEVTNITEAQALARTQRAMDRLNKRTGGASEGLKTYRDEVSRVQKEISDLQERQPALEAQANAAEATYKKLQQEVEAEQKTATPEEKKLQEAVKNANAEVVKAEAAEKKAAQEFSARVKSLNDACNAIPNPPNPTPEQAATRKKQLAALEEVIAKLIQLVDKQQAVNRANIAAARKQEAQVIANLQALQKSTKSLTASLEKASQETKRLRGQVSSTASRISSLRSRLTQLQAKIAAAE